MGLDQGQLTAVRHRRDIGRAGAPATCLRPAGDRGPMLVEFIGIPGSGKTTLCSAIASELRRDGFTIITEHDYFRWMQAPLRNKIGAVVTNGMRTWCFVLHVYRFLYRCTSLRGLPLLSMGYHLTCMHVWLSRMVARTPPVPILLDGFAWFRLTNRLREYPAIDLGGSQLTRTVALFYPRCDAHWIFKTVPVELAVQRISRRKLRDRAPKGIERSSPDRRRVLLQRQTQLYQSVFHAIRARYRDNVYCVNGAEPIPDQVRHIKSIIAESLKQETSATPVFHTSQSA